MVIDKRTMMVATARAMLLLRRSKDWTQEQFAKKAKMLPNTYSYKESGFRAFKAAEIARLLKAAGVDEDDFSAVVSMVMGDDSLTMWPRRPAKVSAGRTNTTEDHPNRPGADEIIVDGDSMSPTLESGWRVKLRRVWSPSQIKRGDTVAVVFSGKQRDGQALYSWWGDEGGRVRLMKVNTRYSAEDFEGTMDDIESIAVVAEVKRGQDR